MLRLLYTDAYASLSTLAPPRATTIWRLYLISFADERC